ncbi:MAG: hypothetical protein IKW30_01845 [Lachnospiraceae bacterium]|nr:hypothetical protein [Lachnospiraceae bacterium]
MEQSRRYRFTNKKHPEKGIMSVILGIISLVSIWIAVYQTFLARGEAATNMGVVGLTITIFSVIGLVLGYIAKKEQDKFMFFPYLGMVLNVLALAGISVILYAGAYGI